MVDRLNKFCQGSSGNSFVNYSEFDSRGHPWRKIDGPSTQTFTFDSAERLTHVRANGGLMLKQYTYGTANAGVDYRLGKLVQSDRFNRPMIGATLYNATVRELFRYAGDQGRVSLKETAD